MEFLIEYHFYLVLKVDTEREKDEAVRAEGVWYHIFLFCLLFPPHDSLETTLEL